MHLALEAADNKQVKTAITKTKKETNPTVTLGHLNQNPITLVQKHPAT